MKQYSTILFQLDESCRLIEDGRDEHLRVALLLLDNAAEIQMDWAIRVEQQFAAWQEQSRELALQIPASERTPRMQELVDWQPLTKTQRRAIDRFFNAKVDFLSSIPEQFNPAYAAPLKYLHGYRNEAYHRGEVRQETLNISCRLLVEINCDLLESLHRLWTSQASNVDYSWLEQRYGRRVAELAGDKGFPHWAAEELRNRAFVDDESVATALSEHFDARVTRLLENLDFILENANAFESRDDVFRTIQYFATLGDGADPSIWRLPRDYRPPTTVGDVEALRDRRREILACGTRLEAFGVYSTLEGALEGYEGDVREAALQVDMAVQDAVDRALGK